MVDFAGDSSGTIFNCNWNPAKHKTGYRNQSINGKHSLELVELISIHS